MGMPVATHTYRTDPRVPPFDDSRPIIIFDGNCVLCSRGVQFMLKRDPHGTSRFAAIQDDIPRALYAHYDLNADTFDTFMVLANGIPHTKWRGVLAAGRTMPAPWRILASAARIVPNFIGDKIYDWVQRNRIGWFGARETCYLPDENTRARFLIAPTRAA
jgi:predicted DCC family thiol-disulfide oxidoreductase YuxK